MLWGRKFLWSQNLGNTDSDGVKRAPLCNCQGLGCPPEGAVESRNSLLHLLLTAPFPLQNNEHCLPSVAPISGSKALMSDRRDP